MDKIKALFKNRFIRFLVAGGINTVFSYCCFSLLMMIIGNKEIAVALNTIIAVFFNYNTSAKFVFRNNDLSLIRIFRFYIVYFITYPLNLLHLYLTVDMWGWNVYVSQLSTLLYFPLITFALQKIIVFRTE